MIMTRRSSRGRLYYLRRRPRAPSRMRPSLRCQWIGTRSKGCPRNCCQKTAAVVKMRLFFSAQTVERTTERTQIRPHPSRRRPRRVARETFTKLIDDLDGGEAHETVKFGLDGHFYEI